MQGHRVENYCQHWDSAMLPSAQATPPPPLTRLLAVLETGGHSCGPGHPRANTQGKALLS